MHSSRMRTARSLTASRSIRRVVRITDACENITLPQTSFAGGKNRTFKVLFFFFMKSKIITFFVITFTFSQQIMELIHGFVCIVQKVYCTKTLYQSLFKRCGKCRHV